MTYNGYVNLKKLSYGSFWEGSSWIGDVKNKYKGAQTHAKKSIGKYPLRVFIFVCNDINNVIKAKKEIRELFKIGNFSVHINDTREEAICLAETYFNENTLKMINKRHFLYEDEDFDNYVQELKNNIKKYNLDENDFLGIATSPYGIRKSGDLDICYLGSEKISFFSNRLSDNRDEIGFYPDTPENIAFNSDNYCWYKGIKFASPEILLKIKENRNKPNDYKTCKLIKKYLKRKISVKPSSLSIIKKYKIGDKRIITILGFIKISYRKKQTT